MDDRSALMAAILANADEDTPRLALADWLDENGGAHDRSRAAFIRAQIEHAQRGDVQPEPDAAERAEWLTPLAPLVGPVLQYPPTDIAWTRGLLKYLLCDTGSFLQKALQKVIPNALAAVGVEYLGFYSRTAKFAALASSPAFRWTASVGYPGADDAALAAFASSPEWAHLSGLNFREVKATDSGLKAFAETAGQTRLRRFGLAARGGMSTARGKYTAAGLLAVLESPRFPLLDTLDLESGQPPKFDYAAVLTSPAIKRLRTLRLDSGVPMAVLAACPDLTNLRELAVNSPNVTDTDVTALLANPVFANLTSVKLYGVNWGRPRLTAAVEDRFRERFGDAALRYSPEHR